MAEIYLVGTSHVSQESIEKIDKVFKKVEPTIICVELDKERLQGLDTNRKPSYPLSLIRQIGLFGYIFARFGGAIQRQLSKKTNVKPGGDMHHAIKVARENKIQHAVIDQPIQITLKKLSKAFNFWTFWRIVGDAIGSLIFQKKFAREMNIEGLDVSTIPPDHLIEKLLGYAKKKYPKLYNVLVEERNIYMCKRLNILREKHPDAKIMVVIGAGHKAGMLKILKETSPNKE